ncbi:nuclear transport factor 2 family protein [Cumulibacter soli]|uniref:nuclear transport factor 2 family protein n=1 Tax=Cumulibacter soli TaxID=2546344 RepID=UPI0010679D04|nr:nuclear transport factor 2 family protein [Cumulibacter soli]
MTTTVDAYLASWNATGDARTQLIAQHFAPGVTYTDPMAEVAGHDGLDALIGAVQEQFPGFVFSPVGEADAHHRQLRFNWGLGPAGEEPVVVGFDVVVVDEDGRIRDVRGFLDKVPA